jgi:plastocyanin
MSARRWRLAGLVSVCAIGWAVAPATAAAVPSTLTFSHAGTACQGTGTSANLPSGMSQTGIAFDGSQLLVSCWGDTTITAFSPSSPTSPTTYTVTGTLGNGHALAALGALAYDRSSHTLWACGSDTNHGSGTPERNMSDVGQVVLNSGMGTGTYTSSFVSHGCDNGLAVDPGTAPGRAGTLWTSADTATTIYEYQPPSSIPMDTVPVGTTALLGATPKNSGIAIGGGNFYLANPQTATKRVYQITPDFSSSTQVLSSTHRYEDMECDDVTYAPQTVIWVMWFNQNILKPLPINGTCDQAAAVNTVFVTVNDTGFAPTSATSPQGGTVQWNLLGSVSHSATDNTGMGLFDSGAQAPGGSFQYIFQAAGNYGVIDTPTGHTGTISVPLIAPATGAVNVPFTVTWAAAAPPAGFVEDVQVQKPGSSSWVAWLSKQSGTSAGYTATSAGTYKFRARYHQTTGGASLFSATKSVKVS